MITIINGGTRGLGEAVARRLAATDFTTGLVLTGRSAGLGDALAAELTDGGLDTIYVQADTADPSAPRAIVDTTVERFGAVHGVVNNAATTTRATLFTDTPEHVDRMLAVNLKGPYFLIQAAARYMVEQGTGGSIVNVGSVVGHGGMPKLTAYAMTKSAVTAMTTNLAYGLMRHRIRVNQVNPGWMDTESEHRIQMEEDGQPENWRELAEPRLPFQRLVQPWEVANLIAFCLGPESGLLTGNHIDVDQTVQGGGAGGSNRPDPDDTVWP
jgi:NAD(P)-dependent dehydrogenase (short-subunit alcohol dehydrogenase family)